MDLCRCKYFGQVRLITLVTERSMVNNNNNQGIMPTPGNRYWFTA